MATIEQLEAELARMRKDETPTHSRLAPLWERVVLLLVNGVIMAGMAWAQAGARDDRGAQGEALEVVEIELDRETARASSLYDTAERIFVEADEQGCTVPPEQ